ncbi:MAG: formylglycine-generating enzyme family protein [Treponema sp.]|jgi:formylglycine-generating enzyme required for sulfatase activity|nr:formylglycine-generating enzyme family protein [Treponema sp.]
MNRKTIWIAALAALAVLSGCAGAWQQTERPAAIGDGFIRVEGGTFLMGSPDGGVRDNNELPMRSVTVSTFHMGRFPVTQGEWYDLVGENPSLFQGDKEDGGTAWRNLPVERVNWFDAVQFANARSERAGLAPVYTISGTAVTWNRQANGYRLPTEAEWEFAARGGIVCRENFTFAGSNNVAEVAWLMETSGGTTHPVGSLLPNALGLFDMNGNVYEWMWDWYGPYPDIAETDPVGPADGTARVRRGGCRNCQAWYVTATFRNGFNPEARTGGIG